ncbi:MAG: glycosyltransferase family 2 protein [Alphaproteobacteria bacterium]|nr:glycosyltransferase family 2 protein [Alphaproteobacteria bacterium]
MKKNASISVIIPSYNRADLLDRTLRSVSAQSLPPLEVIIVDDCSTDNTDQIMPELKARYADLSVVFIRHPENKGEAGARNTGILAARGEYLAFLDSDDEWLPQKLERQISFMHSEKMDGCFCEFFITVDGNYDQSVPVTTQDEMIVPEYLMTKGCGYGTGTNLLISKKAIGSHLFDENLRLFTDLDWLYRVTQTATIKILHEPLAYYHKAPMRPGDYILKRAETFEEKYKDHWRTWPLKKRLQVKSVINWYVAHAYAGCHEPGKAARHFALGILQNPIRHPGHYVDCLKMAGRALFKSRT